MKFGDDLAAMDVQRGRDYGLPSYNEYRKAFGFPPYESFDSFVADLGVPEVNNLCAVYLVAVRKHGLICVFPNPTLHTSALLSLKKGCNSNFIEVNP